MTKSQLKVFWCLSIALAIVILLTLVANEGANIEVAIVALASAVLCSAAIFLWVKRNPEDIELLMSDEPDWLVWGKHKQVFTILSLLVIIWLGMALEEYINTGAVSIERVLGLTLYSAWLTFFVLGYHRLSTKESSSRKKS